MLYFCTQGCINHILSSMYICLYAFIRIIFGRIHLLNSRSMNNYIYAFASTFQTFSIPDVSNKET